jgi:hypothetical protein
MVTLLQSKKHCDVSKATVTMERGAMAVKQSLLTPPGAASLLCAIGSLYNSQCTRLELVVSALSIKSPIFFIRGSGCLRWSITCSCTVQPAKTLFKRVKGLFTHAKLLLTTRAKELLTLISSLFLSFDTCLHHYKVESGVIFSFPFQCCRQMFLKFLI